MRRDPAAATRRIALLGLAHETNTFVSSRVTPDVLRASPLLVGTALTAAHEGKRSSLSGFLSLADDHTMIVPLLHAFVTPMGLVTGETFEWFSNEMTKALTAHGPWDAVFLALHGAGVAEGFADMDGELIARTRSHLGPAVPIGVALDMHANISERMIANCTVATLYRTNPHLDAAAQARRCGELVLQALDGTASPVQALRQLPLLANILTHASADEPLASLLAELDAAEAAPETLYAGLAVGYPYADVAEVGMSVLVIDDGDPARANATCEALAHSVWAARAELQRETDSVEEAVRSARFAEGGPTALLDVGDNVGGGAYGDSTVINNELRRQGVLNALSVLTDPAAVAEAAASQVGERVSLTVGATSYPGIGAPLPLDGVVRARSDGRFVLRDSKVHAGIPLLSVGDVVVIESAEYGTIVITSEPFMPFGISPFHDLGISPESYDVIVLKGVIAPRAGFAATAKSFVTVETPGPTAADVRTLPYTKRRMPLFPLEPDCGYEP